MNLNEILKVGCFHVPWPTNVGGEEVESKIFPSRICTELCKERECLNGGGTLLGRTCSFGLSYYQGNIDECLVVCYGTLSENWRSSINAKHAVRFKDDLKGRSLSAPLFVSWFEKLKRFWMVMEGERRRLISEALHPFHETPKLAQEIKNAAEAIISTRPGQTLDEKFSAATNVEKSLLKASELLVDSFDMLAVFFNPDSARLGKIGKVEPYKLIDKLSRILAISRSGGHRKSIALQGDSFRKYEVLDSFRLIPLVLLGNAIKYSTQGDVLVKFTDFPNYTEISFTSTGPLIESEELESIFGRGNRGRHARKMTNDGMGVGLYVAKMAAAANATRISVKSLPLNYSKNNIPLAVNCFSFQARDVSK